MDGMELAKVDKKAEVLEKAGNALAAGAIDKPGGSLMQKIFVGGLGLLSLLYLLNPTGGLVEIIPDNIPVLGNLDEAAVVMLLLYSIGYFRNIKDPR